MQPIVRSIRFSAIVFAATLLAGFAAAQTPEYGPAKGTLVIQGGGNAAGTGIYETFVNLAGGPNAKILIIPTAGGNREKDGSIKIYKEAEVIAPWKRLGLTDVHMLHTADPKEADTEAFAGTLHDAKGVWFVGGRQWNIVDSYAGTRTLSEFRKVLERGGVIGGSSAGASIQGDYLVRGAVETPNMVMAPEPEHQHGFAFLRKTGIDQHINTRNRWDDIIPLIRRYPELLGLGISEGTAIVVTGDRFQVIGKWKVAVHDNHRTYQPWEKPYFVLSAGDEYNMKTRMVEKYGSGDLAPATLKK